MCQTPNWWTPLLACPRCRSPLQEHVVDGRCGSCGLPFSSNGNVLVWPNGTAEPGIRSRSLADYWRVLRYRLDPLASPYSPLTWWNQHCVEAYYRRALHEPRLARAWAGRFLGGLDLPQPATVLDHGCGRGRACAFLGLLGHNAAGQDVLANPWWQKVPAVFAVVPASCEGLPWEDGSFDAVVNSLVIGHMSPARLVRHIEGVGRVLKKGGYWLVLEANSRGPGSHVTRRYYGRLHTLEDVERMGRELGFEVHDCTFEGVRSPVFPRLVSYLRAHLRLQDFDLSDQGSWLEKRVRPERRARWLLRMRRP
jgi:SAM-dependent methyltransferase